MSKNIIQTHQLYKKYKNAENFSVNNVTLDIAEGERYGILGPNGAGKTTLISVLCSLIKPTSGSYQIDGLSPKNKLNTIKSITKYPWCLSNLAAFIRLNIFVKINLQY